MQMYDYENAIFFLLLSNVKRFSYLELKKNYYVLVVKFQP